MNTDPALQRLVQQTVGFLRWCQVPAKKMLLDNFLLSASCHLEQGCLIFLGKINQNGEKYTKWHQIY
jgi:hypothetical protein